MSQRKNWYLKLINICAFSNRIFQVFQRLKSEMVYLKCFRNQILKTDAIPLLFEISGIVNFNIKMLHKTSQAKV